MSHTTLARRLSFAVGAMALIGVTAACSGGGERVAGTVAGESSGCAAVQQQIAAGQSVDVAAAKRCDQQEFAELENARQAARAQGQKPAMQISRTCRLVNERAARGDATLDFDLAFHCRQRERFANTTNAVSGLGEGGQLSSLCRGAQVRKARGESVDAFTEAFCAQEQAKAGGASGQGQRQASTGGASSAPKASAPRASAQPQQNASGEVVCQGSTVTLSGENGAPAASSGQLPIGTRVKVTNLDNGKSVTVEVTSRSGSCILLNNAAFEQVREPGKFLIRRARIERVG